MTTPKPNRIEEKLVKELEEAFNAGRTVENYKGVWQETYSDEYTSAKYPEFQDYLNAITRKQE